MKIDKRQLWNTDVTASAELTTLLDQLFRDEAGTSFIPSRQFTVDTDCPPLFFYTESRDGQNYVSSFTYYGGGGSKSAIMGMSGRQLVTLSGKYIDNKVRGDVLNGFCALEFILDVMCCIAYGVFRSEVSYPEITPEYENSREYQGSLSSVELKISLLFECGYIMRDARDILMKAKAIRNALAHQYLPIGAFGVTDKDMSRYHTPLLAIETIFDAAWFLLLRDYNNWQVEVAQWLLETSAVQLAGEN